MKRGCSIALVLLVAFAIGGALWLGRARKVESAATGDRRVSFEFQGRNREYLVHVPPQVAETSPPPLVLALHGGGGNAENMCEITGLNQKADREGFVVVYPEGITRFRSRLRTWNAGNCCGYALTKKVDDVAFLRAILDRLTTEIGYDPRRVYVTGMSNGGMMAYRVACEMADRIAAIAPVAGALNLAECRPQRPVPVMLFHGTEDRHVRYEGGAPEVRVDWTHPRVDRSVADAESFWVKHNGCTEPPAVTTQGRIVRRVHTGCAEGSEVIVVTINGGGHAWPGGQPGRMNADEPVRGLSATDEMWSFFKRHER